MNQRINPLLRCLIFILIFLLAILSAACHGVDDRSADTQQLVRNTYAFRSLRLGQTESPNSPVATTAAANNGEAVVVLNRAPGSTLVDHLLYVSSPSEVARISFSDGTLPSSAEGGGVQFTFSNYTTSTVDVQAFSDGTRLASATVPLSDVVQKLMTQLPQLNSAGLATPLSRAAESDPVLRALYTKTIIAVQLFGCGAGSAFALAGVPIPPAYGALSQSACESVLVDLLRALIAEGSFGARLIEGLKEEPSCDFSDADWIRNFSNAEQCALGVGSQLIETVLRSFPDIGIAVLGTPTPTPTPASTPKPSSNNDEDDNDDTPRCRRGKFQCSSGDTICNENACDGDLDRRDGSDEASSLCTAEVLCCKASNGCPGENSGTCSATCGCYGSGRQCSASPYLSGCVVE